MRSHRSALPSARLCILLCGILVILGILFVYSSSSVYALEQCGSSSYYLKRQLFGFFLGCIAACILRLLPLRLIRKTSPFYFWGSFLLTAMTLLPQCAVRIHGSNRWIRLAGLSFQPSELLKIAFIIYFAHLLAKKEYHLGSFWRGYIPFVILVGCTSGLLLLQPDFGLAVTLTVTAFTLLFINGARLWHLLVTALAFLPIVALLVMYKPYRLQRILTFLNPWADPKGTGFQIIQSLIAIGSGGWSGVGIGHSKQKFFYLPMQHTDFIFAIIAEEIGFIGVSVIIILFMLILYNGIKCAWRLHNSFNRNVILGFVILITLQALINISVATGLAPTKGISLPFISYGNTGLVCSIGMLGLLLNIAHNDKERSY